MSTVSAPLKLAAEKITVKNIMSITFVNAEQDWKMQADLLEMDFVRCANNLILSNRPGIL